MMGSRKRETVRGRAIYLLPNMITTLAFFSGFYALISALAGQYQRAGVAILAAVLFDALDGRVARMTRTSSTFGMQYDSLSDLFAFGVAPSVLLYLTLLRHLGRVGWLASFLFLACGALRLARFNVQVQKAGQNYFTGLPIPAAASLVASGLLLLPRTAYDLPWVRLGALATTFAVALLMVSTVSYPSAKQIVLPRRTAFQVLAGVVIFLGLAAAWPETVIFLLSFSYVTLGPVLGMWLVRKIAGDRVEPLKSYTLEDEDILEGNGEEVVTGDGP